MEISKLFPTEKKTEFEQNRDKIEKLYNMALNLYSINLYSYVPEDAKCLSVRNYLFTSKPKTRLFSHYTSNRIVAFAFNYERDGKPFLIEFRSKPIVSDILGVDLFDGFSLSHNSVEFIIDGSGRFESGVVFKIDFDFDDNGNRMLRNIYWYDAGLFDYL